MILQISIHALREEGDPSTSSDRHFRFNFYPRPPRGGRPDSTVGVGRQVEISIHALREEGDRPRSGFQLCRGHFYPRPPRGGRRDFLEVPEGGELFLSTPSARRATSTKGIPAAALRFLSTPSARRATVRIFCRTSTSSISIHALREEGDPKGNGHGLLPKRFLSTPSARRATRNRVVQRGWHPISIHALREEGDPFVTLPCCSFGISIHALREEGDLIISAWNGSDLNFYPRPPRGGRLFEVDELDCNQLFLSTPSARRATQWMRDPYTLLVFLSTPSARRATHPS